MFLNLFASHRRVVETLKAEQARADNLQRRLIEAETRLDVTTQERDKLRDELTSNAKHFTDFIAMRFAGEPVFDRSRKPEMTPENWQAMTQGRKRRGIDAKDYLSKLAATEEAAENDAFSEFLNQTHVD